MADTRPAAFEAIRHPKKRAVLAAFAKTACITEAARAAGIHHQTHHNWLKADPDYAAAYAVAKELAIQSLEDIAVARAKESSDTLMIFLLKAARPEKYRETRRDDKSDVSELLKAVLLELAERQLPRDVTPPADWTPLPPGPRPGLPAPPDVEERL
jgi:hypothetical protein